MAANADKQSLETPAAARSARREAAALGRDFGRPLRLGAERLAELRQKVELALAPLARHFSSELGRAYESALHDLREVHAGTVRASLEDPLAAGRFTCAGQAGWIVWDAKAAVAAVERLLCGSAPSAAPRALSPIEASLLRGVLEEAARALAAAGGLAIEGFEIATDVASLLGVDGAVADPHRVALEVKLTSAGASGLLCVYLPGFAPGGAQKVHAIAKLPAHLEPVVVELSVRLGQADVPLAELLALERGDVIALGTPSDGTVSVTVEGQEVARARLGQSEGRVAVALTEMHRSDC